jgi:hypothetical protein
MKIFGLFLTILGSSLLIIAAIGHWTALGNYESAKARDWERFDPRLEQRIRSFSDLLGTTKRRLSDHSLSDREKMDILYGTVADSFVHGHAVHTLFSNWVSFFAGKIDPVFAHIWDPDLLVSKGHSMLCDQSSYVLLRLAQMHGIRGRHVGLHGHVVMEAWYDSDWHLYDPDLEVVPFDSAGSVLSVEQLAVDPALLGKYYKRHKADQFVRSRENNTYMSYPEGARFEWKSNLLAHLERVMEYLKFGIPTALIALGLWLIKRSPSGSVAPKCRPAP